MYITSLIWLPEIIEKLEIKHGVTVEEIEEMFELRAVSPSSTSSIAEP